MVETGWTTAAGLLAVGLTEGCADPRPALVPVTATVTRDGKPLAAADVTFYPMPYGTNRSFGEAKTGPDGTYKVAVSDLVSAKGVSAG
jgi:hypothetical protein